MAETRVTLRLPCQQSCQQNFYFCLQTCNSLISNYTKKTNFGRFACQRVPRADCPFSVDVACDGGGGGQRFIKNDTCCKSRPFFYDGGWSGDLVLEGAGKQSIVPYRIRYDGNEVCVAYGVGMVGEGEILLDDGGSVDISGYIDVNGVSNSSFDLRARMAMYYGAGVIVIGCSGRFTNCCGWFWLPPYEI